MLTAMPVEKICACVVMSFLLLVAAGAAASEPENLSGRPAESPNDPAGLDDAHFPLTIGKHSGSNPIDVRDTAEQNESTGTILTLWEQLAALDNAQRANARIELELIASSSEADHNTATAIAASWNKEDYQTAITRLHELESSGASLALGIAWKRPVTPAGQRMLDIRLGDERDEAQTMNLDFDAQTGNVFAIIRWGSTTGTSAWTMNISEDNGVTWSETYAYTSSVGIIDVDCVVADDFVYVAYVAGNATDEARIRRCLASSGAIDGSFGYQVVFDAGENTVEEVALASNANDYDNRIYYAIIQSNDELRFAYDVSDDGTTWVDNSPASSNPEYGLDITWDNDRDGCSQFAYLSYCGNDGSIHVLGRSEDEWADWTVETGVGSYRTTAISAHEDMIICAFEYPYTNGTGIRYQISYDCGDNWSPGSLAVPDGFTIFGYFEPDVDARNGNGTAIIYQTEAGEFDPMYYRTREGFAPGPWTEPTIFNDYDIYTGSDTAIAYLPPLSGEEFSHGAMYLSLDPDFRTVYFDRPTTLGIPCGDATPPVIGITSPDELACATGLVEITGTVDDPDGTYVGDRLEYLRHGTDTWIEADTAIGARSGILYTWDTTGLPEDYFSIRIIGENECGLTGSDITSVYKSDGFDDLQLTSPIEGSVVGGDICITGTAWAQSFDEYIVSYRPAGSGIWLPVDPLNPVYESPVTNGLLASWDPYALGLADRDFDLLIIARNECGQTASETITVAVDNEPPTTILAYPANCDVFAPGESIGIIGKVDDINIKEWTLAVFGGPYDEWHTIAGPSTSGELGILYSWDTTGLPSCAYTIRLQASDQSLVDCAIKGHVSEDYVSILLGGLGDADLDQDGDVDLADFMLFQSEFTGPLP